MACFVWHIIYFTAVIVGAMKIPCEIVVWYILPTIRREVARELVQGHKMSQAEVARKFGVTDAAISQYLKKKRGDNPLIDESPHYDHLLNEIKRSADNIAAGDTEFSSEVCRLCAVVKSTGILANIYRIQLGCDPPACACDTHVISQIS